MTIHAFYSDPHFFHTNIIKYTSRPFADVTEMNNVLIRNYNAMVKPWETVLWTGDCFFYERPGKNSATDLVTADMVRRLLLHLNGHKHLIRGNHDRDQAEMAALGFSLVMDECVMRIANQTCRVSHFPYNADPKYEAIDKFKELRPKKYPNEFLIHGHSHGKTPVNGHCIDVGVDAWNYGPARYEAVEEIVRSLTRKPGSSEPPQGITT